MLVKEKNTRIVKRNHKVKNTLNYPYIVRNKYIFSGIPIISGTRIAVWNIAGYYQMGMSVDEILITLKHLTPAQVHSSLAYYFDHKKEIDKEITINSNIEFWKKKVTSIENNHR